MNCPSCKNDLVKVQVTTDAGDHFDVDHCGRCGGTWFDPYELNRIPYHEVVRIAHLTVWRNKIPVQSDHPMRCPCDSHILENFHSDSLPAGVRFLRCKYCFGIWANQKGLTEFKKKQEETQDLGQIRHVSAFPTLTALIIPAILLLLLFISTFITIRHLQSRSDSRALAASYIQNVSIFPVAVDAVTISFETTKELRSRITYGESILTQGTLWISVAPVTTHTILLSNLKTDTTYTFSITFEDDTAQSFTTPLKSFSTGQESVWF